MTEPELGGAGLPESGGPVGQPDRWDAKSGDADRLPEVLPGEERCLLRERQLFQPVGRVVLGQAVNWCSQAGHDKQYGRRSAHLSHSQARGLALSGGLGRDLRDAIAQPLQLGAPLARHRSIDRPRQRVYSAHPTDGE